MGWPVRGSNPRWGEILHIRPDRPWSPATQQWKPGLFSRGKAAEAWRWPHTHLALWLKKE